MRRPTLIVMAKAPRLGHGKSRLARALGAVEALRINRFLHRCTMRAAHDPRWRTILAVTPRAALTARFPGLWPHTTPRIWQGQGDLGARLARAFARSCGPTAVIGADCPDLTRADIAEAFAALRRTPFAIGPSEDGGFWLFAARNPRRAAASFASVRWSTPHACADLSAALPERATMLPKLLDVDDAADWRRFLGNARRRNRVGAVIREGDPA